MSPFHSIGKCPVCGGGLCGVRICGAPTASIPAIHPKSTPATDESMDKIVSPRIDSTVAPHGLIVCDECEAIWLDPDLTTPHQYSDPEDPRCPICCDSLWSGNSRWAKSPEVHYLGWLDKIDPKLDFEPESHQQTQPGYPYGHDGEIA